MKPFNIKLSEDHRDKLEAIRKAQGLRSEADTVRYLIEMRSRMKTTADLPKVAAPGLVATWGEAATPDLEKKPPVPYGSRLKKPKGSK